MRFNATAAYSFPTGKLKGLRVGGSTRFRDQSVIGYVSDYVQFGTARVLAAKLDQPVYSPAEWFFDGFVAYRGRLSWRDLRFRLQLNVQNVLDETDLYATYSDSYGNPVRFAQFEGRRAILTAGIEF